MTEWTSPRLAQAYALIEAERDENARSASKQLLGSLSDALDAIELADCELADAS